MIFGPRIELKSPAELELMHRAGQLTRQVLSAARSAAVPGATTAEVDAAAEAVIDSAGARSNFKGYQGFPAVVCISVNEEIVHGIPGPRPLAPGDVVKLDVTLELDGYMADSAVTVLVPPVRPEVQRLQRAARVAFNRGLDAARAGRTLREVGHAVEAAARRQKWIDQAQSLNIYMAGASGKKLDETYKLAWLRGLKTTYYLRTFSATQAEKSTGRAGQLNAVQSGPAARDSVAHAPKDEPAESVAFCALDDPTCEACQ